MVAFGLGGGGVGVDHLPQLGHRSAQPGWVQPPGRRHQHRFGLSGDVVGQVLGAGGQHAGMGRRELALDQRLGGGGQRAAEQGPGGADTVVGGAGSHP
jgi:hypothetical protein